MPTVFLSSYTVRLIDRSTGQMLPIGNFLQGADLLAIFNQYLASLRANLSHDSEAQKLLSVLRYSTKGRNVSGIVETGDYGYESTLYDVQSHSIAHHRTVNEAEMLPFYFIIKLPQQEDEGILLLQRFGQFGIKSTFCDNFIDYFELYYPQIALVIYPLVPLDLITEYLTKGRVTKIRFIKFSIPSDMADFIEHGHDEEDGQVEFVIKARRNGRIPIVDRLLDLVQRRGEVRSFYEIRDFEYDNVKVEIYINGRRRTIDLSHLERLKTYYDITEDIEIGTTGHPVFESIHEVASGLLNDLSTSIGHHDVQ